MSEQEDRASAMRRHPSNQSRLRGDAAEPEQGQHDDEIYEEGARRAAQADAEPGS